MTPEPPQCGQHCDPLVRKGVTTLLLTRDNKWKTHARERPLHHRLLAKQIKAVAGPNDRKFSAKLPAVSFVLGRRHNVRSLSTATAETIKAPRDL